ncbi:MAG: rhodanese-like domain-containing protein [Bdellovibrio sp.]|nr:MAG: rhodanese-like domain-containing protein [Bdellovibrio sp.]
MKSFIFLILLLASFHSFAENSKALTKNQLRLKIEKLYEKWTKDFQLEEISPKELQSLLQQKAPNVIVVDARSPEEVRVSKIPHAITKEEILKAPHTYKNKLIVTYCTIGYRSGQFATELKEKYHLKVKNLKGSLLGWVLENGPLVTPEGKPTKKVHVYSRKWKLVPPDYIPVW